MCLAVPARVVTIDLTTETATVALGAVTKDVSLALVDGVSVGDYVLVHVGYALTRIRADEAELTLALMAEATGLAAPAGEGAP
jgi:hydrogenase expression/formation protein HypC